jgi:hypothetical protein
MAKVKKDKKAAAVTSTAKQTNTDTINNDSINTQEDKETSLKSHSMTSQKEIKARSYKNVGRPAVNIDYDKLEGFASQNIENYKIAEALGISTATFYKYMKEDEKFKEAYEQGMENRKYELEKALYKRATGFEGQEVVTEKDETGNITKTKITNKMYVPDTTALIFTLSNRYGERYKQRVESTLDININYNDIQQLSNDELVKLASNMVEAEYQIE